MKEIIFFILVSFLLLCAVIPAVFNYFRGRYYWRNHNNSNSKISKKGGFVFDSEKGTFIDKSPIT